ncbi:hypothetical protein [Leptolyngbya sp. NIES-2104]|uniref:hypothetical protein n=1 Tax=Leptolyngbya sp. NIES-2104 TaxID=1552121 RepID=UPI0006EC45F7|nr:hypothetical protein [Leptolyngbya sp. NIES-2104]GAP97975.1 hypothetical protein NIES2104_45280 [Leptolyngbya sp. NIES-2104]
MACQGAVPPTEPEVKQAVQEVMALLSSKYHVYREPIEQYKARMMTWAGSEPLIEDRCPATARAAPSRR